MYVLKLIALRDASLFTTFFASLPTLYNGYYLESIATQLFSRCWLLCSRLSRQLYLLRPAPRSFRKHVNCSAAPYAYVVAAVNVAGRLLFDSRRPLSPLLLLAA